MTGGFLISHISPCRNKVKTGQFTTKVIQTIQHEQIGCQRPKQTPYIFVYLPVCIRKILH
jgi:hypothetical protein